MPSKITVPDYFIQFLDPTIKDLRDLLYKQSMSSIPSSTLRESLEIAQEGRGSLKAQVPHFWATILHDGRGAVRKNPDGPMLAYYRDVTNDPRIANGYPERLDQVLKLSEVISPEQFRADVKSGELILARSVGPTQATNFFDNDVGFSGFKQKVVDTVLARFRQFSKAYATGVSFEVRTRVTIK